MAMNQAFLQLQHLHKIHLFAPWRRPRILPHEFGSIGKESGAIALALRRLSLENQTDKAAQLVVPLADAAFDPQKLNNERTFNGCVSSVQGEGCLKVLRFEGFVPCFVNVLAAEIRSF